MAPTATESKLDSREDAPEVAGDAEGQAGAESVELLGGDTARLRNGSKAGSKGNLALETGQDRGTKGGHVRLHEAHDGAIHLGSRDHEDAQYITRFKVHRSHQMKATRRGKLMKQWVPCCEEDKRTNPRRFCWGVLRSETFILTIHLIAIALGASKAGLDYQTEEHDKELLVHKGEEELEILEYMKEEAEQFELLHSIVETVAAVLVIILRMVSAWHGYGALQKFRRSIEVVHEGAKLRAITMKYQMIFFTCFGSFLIAMAVMCFLMFYYVAHLGWTILSNNFFLTLITIASATVLETINREKFQIREDNHKAVIFESLLVMNECVTADTDKERQEVSSRVSQLTKSVLQTDLLLQPHYMHPVDEQKDTWDAIAKEADLIGSV